MTLKVRSLLAALALISGAAVAGEAANIAINDAYVRLPPPGQNISAAFMRIDNSGDARKLVKADSAVAGNVELHNHINDGGVMRMRQVKSIDVPAKGKAVLQPGGYHIMLIGLKAPLKDGQKVALTLTFDDGSSKTVDAPVQRPGAMPMPMPMSEHEHHQHQHGMAQ